MTFSFVPTSLTTTRTLVVSCFLLLAGAFVPPTFADSGQNSARVTVSFTVPGGKIPAQPFVKRSLPGDGWIGGATLASLSFPPADIKSVTIIYISIPSDPGSVAMDRLWIRVGEAGGDFVPLDEVAGSSLANPNATDSSQLPEIEFRPTWRDAPGKYHARLKITPDPNVNASTEEPRFCELEADVPPFLNFEIENSLIRFVPSPTAGDLQVAQNIHVRVTTNSEHWRIKLSCSQDDQTCPVWFELLNRSQELQGPVSGYSSQNGTVTGRSAVDDHLLVFRPVCRIWELKDGPIQVSAEGYTGN